jgi:hypothetical protein
MGIVLGEVSHNPLFGLPDSRNFRCNYLWEGITVLFIPQRSIRQSIDKAQFDAKL